MTHLSRSRAYVFVASVALHSFLYAKSIPYIFSGRGRNLGKIRKCALDF